MLAVPDNEHKFQMEVDVSGYTIGGVLSQQQTDSFWWLIAFMSQALNEIERNYEIYNQELLAIMTGLKLWWHYLIDSKFEPWIFQETSEAKLMTGTMALRNPRLWLWANPQAGIYYEEGRYSIKTTRLWSRKERQQWTDTSQNQSTRDS